MANLELENKKKQDLEKRKNFSKILKIYIVPILSIIAFLVIVFGVDLGKVQEVFGSLDQLSANNEEITRLNSEVLQLSALDGTSQQITSDLAVVNEIAANSDTQLISFRDKVSLLITENNLQIISQKLSETTLSTEQVQNQKSVSGNVNLVELPFIFEIAGDFEDIKNFIAEINTIDDFTIVKEMELSSLSNASTSSLGEWSLKITLVKYQFITSDSLINLYKNVPATAKISDQMKEYIELRK